MSCSVKITAPTQDAMFMHDRPDHRRDVAACQACPLCSMHVSARPRCTSSGGGMLCVHCPQGTRPGTPNVLSNECVHPECSTRRCTLHCASLMVHSTAAEMAGGNPVRGGRSLQWHFQCTQTCGDGSIHDGLSVLTHILNVWSVSVLPSHSLCMVECSVLVTSVGGTHQMEGVWWRAFVRSTGHFSLRTDHEVHACKLRVCVEKGWGSTGIHSWPTLIRKRTLANPVLANLGQIEFEPINFWQINF